MLVRLAATTSAVPWKWNYQCMFHTRIVLVCVCVWHALVRQSTEETKRSVRRHQHQQQVAADERDAARYSVLQTTWLAHIHSFIHSFNGLEQQFGRKRRRCQKESGKKERRGCQGWWDRCRLTELQWQNCSECSLCLD